MAPISRQGAARQNTRASQGARKAANGGPSRQVSSSAGPARQVGGENDDDDDSMDVDFVGPMVRIKTSDGKRFCLSEWEVSCSNTLRRMVESSASQQTGSTSGEYIHLEAIRGPTLRNILDWTRHHCRGQANNTRNGRQPGCGEDHRGDDCNCNHLACPRTARGAADLELTEEDKSYMSLFSEEDLLELMHASNFLDVGCLFDTCCKLMAKRWEGKKVEEIRRMYGIRGDFGFDEESQMIQDNKRLGLSE